MAIGEVVPMLTLSSTPSHTAFVINITLFRIRISCTLKKCVDNKNPFRHLVLSSLCHKINFMFPVLSKFVAYVQSFKISFQE
jgi:hypothetical protein